MSLATVRSCALAGISASPVVVEVHLGGGLPGMAIVGLPESAVRESKDRVRAAIRHAGFRFPKVKVIVNLAPADLPKRGGRFDLPIALGILLASGQLPEGATAGLVVVGELGLGGELRPVEGALPAARACREAGEALLMPAANLAEALRCPAARVIGAGSLVEACAGLAREGGPSVMTGGEGIPGALSGTEAREGGGTSGEVGDEATGGTSGRATGGGGDAVGAVGARGGDLADVIGQHGARRALEIAAAGAHNLLLCGPPGTGKSMLASRLPGILPPMDERAAGEAAAIASVARTGFDAALWGVRPFRAPHHTVSGIALVGGGVPPMPGEASLAHEGVLFLDELTEFRRAVLDVLREPMETGRIALSRAAWQVEFPARFQLVAAMNPCPCGRRGEEESDRRGGRDPCRCSVERVLAYRSRLSAPFLERIDLHVDVRREPLALAMLPFAAAPGRTAEAAGGVDGGTVGGVGGGVGGSTGDDVGGGAAGDGGGIATAESSETVRRRVTAARRRQLERQGCSNAALAPGRLGDACGLDREGRALLARATDRLGLSLRAVHRIVRVARTVADLDGDVAVGTHHLGEALGYRERGDGRAAPPELS